MTTIPIISEPAAIYDQHRATTLTSSGIRDFIKCPRTHWLKSSGMMPMKSSKAFELGTAIHMRILEGSAAYSTAYYIVDPTEEPINAKTGKAFGPTSKAYTEWLEDAAQGRATLTSTEDAMVQAMHASVANHPEAARLFEQGQPEGVIRTDINSVPCQIRMDWFNEDAGIIDLKTIADIDKFGDHFEDFQYDLQFAFYQIVAEEVLGKAMPFFAVVIEKAPTHRCGVFTIDQHRMIRARRTILDYIKEYADALDADRWPTRYEFIRMIGGES